MNNFYFGIIIFILIITALACDKEVSVSEPYSYEKGIAKYFITTNPPGASIRVDDKPTGLFTPDTVKWLKEGMHKFDLDLEPFLNYSFSDIASNNELNELIYDFNSDPRNFGSIRFTSIPDSCEVYLNDSLMSFKTPHVLGGLLAGDYKIKYTFPEHRADSLLRFVRGGKQTEVQMELRDTSVWVTYNKENSDITDNTINDIYVDNDGIIWIATWHNGLIKISKNKKEFITESNSNLPNDITHCFMMDQNNVMWVGTYGGIAKINGNVINTLTTVNSGLPSNYIADIEMDSQHNVWIATRKGLVKYDGSAWEVYNTSNSSIPSNVITKILFDQNDALWIGTYSFNTARYDGNDTWTTYQSDEYELGDSIADLIIGSDNKLWIGLIPEFTKPGAPQKPGGVYVLENNELVEVEFYLQNKRINRFFNDEFGTLWIGSRSGLLSVESRDDFRHFTNLNSGLPINDVLSINKDTDNNLWLGTNGGGLVKYKLWNE
jgi:sugar lactone lactonase YvrE